MLRRYRRCRAQRISPASAAGALAGAWLAPGATPPSSRPRVRLTSKHMLQLTFTCPCHMLGIGNIDKRVVQPGGKTVARPALLPVVAENTSPKT
jgi:hypothetical protein